MKNAKYARREKEYTGLSQFMIMPHDTSQTVLDTIVGALTQVPFSLGDVDFENAHTTHRHARSGRRGDVGEIYFRQMLEAANAASDLGVQIYDSRGHRLNGVHCMHLNLSGYVVSERLEGFEDTPQWYDRGDARVGKHSWDLVFVCGGQYFVAEVKSTTPGGFKGDKVERALRYAEMLSDDPRSFDGRSFLTDGMPFGGMIVALPYELNSGRRILGLEEAGRVSPGESGSTMIRCVDLGYSRRELRAATDRLQYLSPGKRRELGITPYRTEEQRHVA